MRIANELSRTVARLREGVAGREVLDSKSARMERRSRILKRKHKRANENFHEMLASRFVAFCHFDQDFLVRSSEFDLSIDAFGLYSRSSNYILLLEKQADQLATIGLIASFPIVKDSNA